MNPINLYEYIKNGLVLTNLAWRDLFDVVVYESFTNTKVVLPKELPMLSLSDLGQWNGVAWKILELQKRYKKILFVMENTSVEQIISLLRIPEEKEATLTIVNLSSGLSWLVTSWKTHLEDIAVARTGKSSICDPHDVVQCFWLLEKEGNNYIRIQAGDYPPALVENVPTTNEGWLYSLIKHGLSWPMGTLIVWWRVANEILYACSKLQEESVMYDSFLCTDWRRSITDELRDSLLRTEKIIIVTDWDEEYMKEYTQSKLFQSWMYEVEVIIIAPDQANVTTTQIEYLYEQAWFGIEAFVEKLSI